MSRPPLPGIAILLAGIAGCAQQGDFPSLAPRPIETIGEAESTPAPPPTPVTADAALITRLAPIVAAADSGHERFLSELAAARPIIERADGAAPGSEAWVAGHQALSRVSAARGALTAALADLDFLRREQMDSANPANRAALDEARQRIAARDAEESAALTELFAKLG